MKYRASFGEAGGDVGSREAVEIARYGRLRHNTGARSMMTVAAVPLATCRPKAIRRHRRAFTAAQIAIATTC
jgi:hypothetical protein